MYARSTGRVSILLLVLHTLHGADTRGAGLSLKQTENTITLSSDGAIVLVYNKQSPPVPDDVESVYARSGFLHPVGTPTGQVVTAVFPRDHKHQNGIFSAWVNTTYRGQKVDFWNVAGGSGRVLHERVVTTTAGDDSAGFEVDLLHQSVVDEPVDILRERWKITAMRTDGSYHCFDLHTTQTALTDSPLKIHEYRYGGLALRGRSRWVLSKDRDQAGETDSSIETGFINGKGSDRISGNHQKTRWVSLYGTIDGKAVSISVLSHPNNFRAPQTARLHPTKPYFCFAPCVDGQFEIDREHPYVGQYRYLVTNAVPDTDWLNDQWNLWTAEK